MAKAKAKQSESDARAADEAKAAEKAAKANRGDLEHSEGGRTTKDDGDDLGVDMLPGDGSEPQGPEDALGPGPKRGDYRDRLGGSSSDPHEIVADDDGVQAVPQKPRAEEIGDEAGLKGGVETA